MENTMSAYRFQTSKADPWVEPRPYSDANTRRAKHGPLQSMYDDPGLLERILSPIMKRAHRFVKNMREN